MVGMTRLELATPRPPDVCATKLRYIPMQRYYYSMQDTYLFCSSTAVGLLDTVVGAEEVQLLGGAVDA